MFCCSKTLVQKTLQPCFISREICTETFFYKPKMKPPFKLEPHLAHKLHKNNVFSKDSQSRCVINLKNMTPHKPHENFPRNKVALLVPLCVVKNEVCLLYAVRSINLRKYGGKVSFPGGMKDDKDTNLKNFIVRETYEELGIEPSRIDVWGSGHYINTGFRHVGLLPFVGCVGEIDVKELQLGESKVRSVFTVPLKHFCDNRNCRYTFFRNRYALPAFIGAEYRIWGITAIITHLVLSALLPNTYKYIMKPIKH